MLNIPKEVLFPLPNPPMAIAPPGRDIGRPHLRAIYHTGSWNTHSDLITQTFQSHDSNERGSNHPGVTVREKSRIPRDFFFF